MKLLIAVSTLLCAVLAFAVFTPRRESSPSTTIAATLEPFNGKRSPVIVELFTSEGCSSCPPADAVLAQLQKDQPVAYAEVIALSEHVDYWNYIGWADPFSSAAFSARQESYAGAFGSERIYTPQMVVDGQLEFVGNSLSKAREAITTASQASKADVRIEARTDDVKDNRAILLSVSVKGVPQISRGDVAETILAVTEDDLSSNVSRGENTGRRLAHTAVVREMRALGKVDGATGSFAGETTMMIADGWKRDDLRVVVFVQERAHRRVLGAASIKLGKAGNRA
ncbi:MAG: hypothetical protein JMDDDDMK_03368 [Acidobacteria bacterium]|nr:hypothetical protein [Acidobacteriota bacterium]